MNILRITSRFKKDLKRYKHRTHVIDKLEAVLKLLAACLIVAAGFTAAAQSTRRSRIKPVKDVPATAVSPVTAPVTAADTITDRGVIEGIAKWSDYKKAVASRVESILVTNLSATDTIKALHLDIDYRTPKGKQLNRRNIVVKVTVPPGQTRHASFDSWDRQQLFYHISTPPVRNTRRTSAFTVNITPTLLVLTKPDADD